MGVLSSVLFGQSRSCGLSPGTEGKGVPAGKTSSSARNACVRGGCGGCPGRGTRGCMVLHYCRTRCPSSTSQAIPTTVPRQSPSRHTPNASWSCVVVNQDYLLGPKAWTLGGGLGVLESRVLACLSLPLLSHFIPVPKTFLTAITSSYSLKSRCKGTLIIPSSGDRSA